MIDILGERAYNISTRIGGDYMLDVNMIIANNIQDELKKENKKGVSMRITSETPLALFDVIIHHVMNFVNRKISFSHHSKIQKIHFPACIFVYFHHSQFSSDSICIIHSSIMQI